MTPAEFKALLVGGTIRVVVWCGADGCGRIDAAIDDKMVVHKNPEHAKRHDVRLFHRHGDEWELRQEIYDAFFGMTVAERRSRKPKNITLAEEPYRLRQHPEQIMEETSAWYQAYRDRHVEVEDIFDDAPDPHP